MTHDTTPDASARTCRESLDLWRRAQIAMGHSEELVDDVIRQCAEEIALGDPRKPVHVGEKFRMALEAQGRTLEAMKMKGQGQ